MTGLTSGPTRKTVYQMPNKTPTNVLCTAVFLSIFLLISMRVKQTILSTETLSVNWVKNKDIKYFSVFQIDNSVGVNSLTWSVQQTLGGNYCYHGEQYP